MERDRIMARMKGCSPSPSPDDTTDDDEIEKYDDDDTALARAVSKKRKT